MEHTAVLEEIGRLEESTRVAVGSGNGASGVGRGEMDFESLVRNGAGMGVGVAGGGGGGGQDFWADDASFAGSGQNVRSSFLNSSSRLRLTRIRLDVVTSSPINLPSTPTDLLPHSILFPESVHPILIRSTILSKPTNDLTQSSFDPWRSTRR